MLQEILAATPTGAIYGLVILTAIGSALLGSLTWTIFREARVKRRGWEGFREEIQKASPKPKPKKKK